MAAYLREGSRDFEYGTASRYSGMSGETFLSLVPRSGIQEGRRDFEIGTAGRDFEFRDLMNPIYDASEIGFFKCLTFRVR